MKNIAIILLASISIALISMAVWGGRDSVIHHTIQPTPQVFYCGKESTYFARECHTTPKYCKDHNGCFTRNEVWCFNRSRMKTFWKEDKLVTKWDTKTIFVCTATKEECEWWHNDAAKESPIVELTRPPVLSNCRKTLPDEVSEDE